MALPKPFQISIPQPSIDELKTKLQSTRFPDELQDAGWDYGVPLNDVRRLTKQWLEGYDWKKHEKEINDTLPQFTLDIDVVGEGVMNVHFVHKKSEKEGAIPLLFIHGCESNLFTSL